MLDVQQIFGRAGRPQFEDEGLGIIITQHAQLSHYLGMLTHQTPIESQFTKGLVDNLNAEIVLGGWSWLWSAYCSKGVTCCAGTLLHGLICIPAVAGASAGDWELASQEGAICSAGPLIALSV